MESHQVQSVVKSMVVATGIVFIVLFVVIVLGLSEMYISYADNQQPVLKGAMHDGDRTNWRWISTNRGIGFRIAIVEQSSFPMDWPPGMRDPRESFTRLDADELPAWIRGAVSEHAAMIASPYRFAIVQVGWPLPMFRSTISTHSRSGGTALINDGTTIVRSGVSVPTRSMTLGGVGNNALAYVVPTAPCWGGIIANAGLFAVVVLGPIVLRNELVAYWRKARGLCAHCGYDLHASHGTGCPECGNGAH